MPRYRWNGPNAVVIPDAGVTVSPGDEFDTANKLDHPYLELVTAKAKSAASPED